MPRTIGLALLLVACGGEPEPDGRWFDCTCQPREDRTRVCVPANGSPGSDDAWAGVVAQQACSAEWCRCVDAQEPCTCDGCEVGVENATFALPCRDTTASDALLPDGGPW